MLRMHMTVAVSLFVGGLVSSAHSADVWVKDLDQRSALSAAFSPDGLLLAAGGNGGDVVLWNTKTRVKVAYLESETSAHDCRHILFSPDGKTIATVDSYTIEFWDVATKTLRASAKGRQSRCEGLVFSPDNQWLIGGTQESDDLYVNKDRVAMWNVKTGEMQHMSSHVNEISGLERDRWNWRNIYDVAVSSDGKWILSASDQKVGFWKPSIGLTALHKVDQGIVYSVTISRNGKMYAVASTQAAYLWKQLSAKKAVGSTLPAAFKECKKVEFTSDGKYLIFSGGSAGSPPNVAAKTVTPTKPLRSSGRVDPTAKMGSIRIWSVSRNQPVWTSPLGFTVKNYALDPDRNLIAYSGDENATHLVDLNTRKEIANIPTSGRMSFSSQEQMLCIASNSSKTATQIVYFEEPLPDPKVAEPVAAKGDNEQLASGLLQKAKIAQRKKRRKIAGRLLRKVISDYPKTKAASEAQKILGSKKTKKSKNKSKK